MRLSQSGYNEVVEIKANPILGSPEVLGNFRRDAELVVILSWYLQKYPTWPSWPDCWSLTQF